MTAQRFLHLVKPFFTGDAKWQAWGLLATLAVLSLSSSGLHVLLSYRERDFMNALEIHEKGLFFGALINYLLVLSAITPVVVFYTFTEQSLAVVWRRWLSRKLLNLYFTRQAYYKLARHEAIDNPDQRIEEDVRSFCATSLSLFLIICNSVLTLVLFLGILYSISINLVFAVISYSIVGSVVTYLVGRPLVRLNVQQLRKEADYRYKLVKIRDNTEAIAFLRGEKKELTRSRQRLKKALDNFGDIIRLNRRLGLFTTPYNYLKGIIPIIVVLPLFLDEKIGLGEVTQSASVFIRVTEALSVIVTQFGQFSSLGAVVTRLGTFWEAVEDAASDHKDTGPQIEIETGPRVVFDNVSIFTPKRDQTLLKDLSFCFQEGGLLITGASGSGKSSILRTLFGIWRSGSGKIIRPPLDETMFLPQRPYLIVGSLRSQLLYGTREVSITDTELVDLLRSVGLSEMLGRIGGLDTFLDWQNVLSTGEQQLVTLARVMLAKPKFLFMDESTTALDEKAEERMLTKIQQVTQAYISVGFHDTLAPFHHTTLRLLGEGKWQLEMNK